MHLDLSRKTFFEVADRKLAVLISRKRRHYCSQWEGKWEYLLTERRNVTVNLQERKSGILGLAPKKFYCRVSLKRKKGKENLRSVAQKSMSTDKVFNNKRDKTFFKASKTIYMCIL